MRSVLRRKEKVVPKEKSKDRVVLLNNSRKDSRQAVSAVAAMCIHKLELEGFGEIVESYFRILGNYSQKAFESYFKST